MRSDDRPTEAYAHELLIRARHALPSEASGTQIVERAVILRAEDRTARVIGQLATALGSLAHAKLSVGGEVLHMHTILRQLSQLGGPSRPT